MTTIRRISIEIKQTEIFRNWWSNLKDEHARGFIMSRLDRLSYGYTGDVKSVGNGISELRIHYRAGYRIYFHKKGSEIILLLCGGKKDTQVKDIETAKKLAEKWRNL